MTSDTSPLSDSRPPSNGGALIGKLIQIVFGVAIVAFCIKFVYSRATTITSVDAVINGQLTDIRALDDGTVGKVQISPGDKVSEGDPLLFISNDRLYELKLQKVQREGQIQQVKAERQRLQDGLDRNLDLLSQVAQDMQKQKNLEKSEQEARKIDLQAELEGAKRDLGLAQLTHQRVTDLYAQGVFAKAAKDASEIELAKKQSKVESLQAQIKGIEVNINAVSNNLSLSRTRSNYDPYVREQELNNQIQDQKQEIEVLKSRYEAINQELTQIQKNIEFREQDSIKGVTAPISGTIWNLTIKQGTRIRAGESLGQIIDCHKRWVDVWVDESDLTTLKNHTSAKIKLQGESGSVEGEVTWIRFGSGRPNVGADAMGFLDRNQPGYAQVRVKIPQLPENAKCDIGSRAEVTFQKK